MHPDPPRRHPAAGELLGRIERAAAEINPYLIVVAIGLVVLNIICVVLLAPHLTLTRRGAGPLNPEVAAGAERAIPPPRLGGLQ